MCGLFGFVGDRPNKKLLIAAARGASNRGQDACGWAWKNGSGIERIRHLGPLDRHLADLPEASCLIGHVRLATSGDRKDINQAQPLIERDIAFAHNGIVRTQNFPEIPYEEGSLDSEVIFKALMANPLTVKNLLAVTERIGSVYAILLMTPRVGIVPLRFGNPLYILQRREGRYYSSQRFHEAATPIPAQGR